MKSYCDMMDITINKAAVKYRYMKSEKKSSGLNLDILLCGLKSTNDEIPYIIHRCLQSFLLQLLLRFRCLSIKVCEFQKICFGRPSFAPLVLHLHRLTNNSIYGKADLIEELH